MARWLAPLVLSFHLVVVVVAPDLHELRLIDDDACLPDCMEGLLEIYDGQQWRQVCDDSWDDADAEVACRQLDMRGGKAYNGPGSAEAAIAHSYDCGNFCAASVWQAELSCDGSEERLADCSQSARITCGRSERAGLLCDSGPTVTVLVAIAVNAAAVLAAVVLSCHMAVKRARDLKRLDSVTCTDVLRSWLVVVRTAPRACMCSCCAEKPAGSGYGRSNRKKTAVRQEITTGAPSAAHTRITQPRDVEPSDVVRGVEAASPCVVDESEQIEPSPVDRSQASTFNKPETLKAKGLRRPLSAGGAERRAAVAQRWMQEGMMVATGPDPKRPSELIAEARGEEPEDKSGASKRNRRKSNVTDTWLAQSESAVVPVQPGHADATLPLDPLEPAVEVTTSKVDDDYGQFVTGSRPDVRLGEEAAPMLSADSGLKTIT